MRVLVACEFSGVVRRAFRARGHDAWSCDLLPAEDESPYHVQGDVLEVIGNGWDMMIAHPPCTYLTNAGVRHLHSTPSRNGVVTKVHGEARWQAMREAAEFFSRLAHAEIGKIAVENPIPHGYARELIGKYSQIIQPWQFGHGETKATCLWLKNLPLLKPTNIVDGRVPRVHMTSPGPDRWKIRSRTYQGIADAMSDQWGSLQTITQPMHTTPVGPPPDDWNTPANDASDDDAPAYHLGDDDIHGPMCDCTACDEDALTDMLADPRLNEENMI